MNRTSKLGVLAVTTVLVAAGAATLATEKIAEQEGVDCTVCHEKVGSEHFTDKGKYYETLRTFEGYDKLTEKFGNCLHCHKRKPGSKRLTKEGKRVRKVVRDMQGLFEWLKEGHTGPLE